MAFFCVDAGWNLSLIHIYVLLPAYASAFGWPLDSIIEMGSAINPVVKSLPAFVILLSLIHI